MASLRRALALGLVLFLALPVASGLAGNGETLKGEATVVSGESLEVGGQRLRLAGIDAPDLQQQCLIKQRLYPCGLVSQTALMDLTAGVTVICHPLDRQAAGEPLARCFSDGYDLSEGMVYTGWALADPQSGVIYANLQKQAEAKGRGLWRGRFVMPWDWRQGQRLPEESD